MTAVKIRVALLISGAEGVVVMERLRAGERYVVLPGGGVEPGETIVESAQREAVEELGLVVEPSVVVADLVVEEPEGERRHIVIAAADPGGPVVLGDGPERALQSQDNQHRPRRMTLDELHRSVRRPAAVFAALEAPGGPLAHPTEVSR